MKMTRTAALSSPLSTHTLPVKQNLAPVYQLSLIAAILMGFISIIGLLFPSVLYPSETLTAACLPNDVVNLIIGLPILLGTMWLTKRGHLLGLLFWPGALLYILYNYIAYAFTVPLIWATLLAVVLLVISTIAVVMLITRIDGAQVYHHLPGNIRERVSAGMLIGFGFAFIMRAMDIVLKAQSSQTVLPATEGAILVSDSLLGLAWIIGGITLWRKKPYGYAVGGGLLFQAIALFMGLIMFMLLQPLMTTAPFILEDLIAIVVMSIIYCIPFALFVRGSMAKTS